MRSKIRNVGKRGIWKVAPHPGALRNFYCTKEKEKDKVSG